MAITGHIDNVKAGSLVLYRSHEDWGIGVVRRIEPNGLLLVDFEIDGEPYSDDFHPNELRTTGSHGKATGPLFKRS